MVNTILCIWFFGNIVWILFGWFRSVWDLFLRIEQTYTGVGVNALLESLDGLWLVIIFMLLNTGTFKNFKWACKYAIYRYYFISFYIMILYFIYYINLKAVLLIYVPYKSFLDIYIDTRVFSLFWAVFETTFYQRIFYEMAMFCMPKVPIMD